MVYRALLALPQAREILLKTVLLQEEEPSAALFTDWPLGELCAVEALSGNWTAAHDYARRILATREGGAERSLDLTAPFQIEALLRGGDEALAHTKTGRLGRAAKDMPRYQYLHQRMLAVLATWDGAANQAIAHLQESLSLAQQLNLPGEQWQILTKLAQLYPDASQPQAAKSQKAEIVSRLAERIGDEKLREGFVTAVTF